MEFGWSEEEAAFREEVREFIRETLPADWDAMNLNEEEELGYAREFAQRLVEKKWRTMHWPVQQGGLGYDLWRQLIFSEEVTYHRMPGAYDGGTAMVGPLLMNAGTEEQRQRFLKPIAEAKVSWCQLFTEPESGSDLASLKTRAVADGDDYVVNGQKVFTTGGHLADWGLLACRTDFEAPKHRGISFLLVDMKTPGITIRPLINMTGAHAQNEIFFEDVRVPRTNLLGQQNGAWYLLAAGLSSERSGATGINRPARARRLLEELAGYARNTVIDGVPIGKRPEVRSKLAQMAIEIEVARGVLYGSIGKHVKGEDPSRQNSASKILGGEVNQKLANAGMNMLGLYGQLKRGSKYAALAGRVEHLYRDSVYYTIGLGTSEINRTVIAQRGLGLPR